ncbi:MAG: tRNA (guanosine(37)-N1)-methyltransferase TrmD [bacterium]|nr:tRNA (guanosine(37)-N1)-methyltransferase TrmD [bacterium]
MRFDFITIFPKMFDSYLSESILKRAQKKGLLSFQAHDLRKWTLNKHKKVDDKPYGGGPGMIMMIEPIFRALKALRSWGAKKQKTTRVIILSAKGKQFTSADAVRLSKKFKRIVFICGRYEGVDERVTKYLAHEEFSIGPYVVTGGELPAMIMADAISRQIPGVLGKAESLAEESYSSAPSIHYSTTSLIHYSTDQKEYPQYTRPEIFKPKADVSWRVPKILLSGDHKKISAWRKKMAKG